MCSKIGLSVFCLMTCTQQSYAEGYTEAGGEWQDKRLIAIKVGQDESWIRFLATMASEVVKEFMLSLKHGRRN